VPIYKLDEVVGYATTNAMLGAYPVLYTMNKSVWDSLDPELQQVLTETARDASMKEAQASQENSAKAVVDYADKIVPHEMTGPGYEAWQKATAGIRDSWVERLEGEGHAAAAIDAEWKKLVAGQ
jgi:TRAP-type C4-dicarboxylate transport system substrate-binding protein